MPCVCSVIDHRRHQNVVGTSVTHSPNSSCCIFLFLPHFDIIWSLLLNNCTATCNLLVTQILEAFMTRTSCQLHYYENLALLIEFLHFFSSHKQHTRTKLYMNHEEVVRYIKIKRPLVRLISRVYTWETLTMFRKILFQEIYCNEVVFYLSTNVGLFYCKLP